MDGLNNKSSGIEGLVGILVDGIKETLQQSENQEIVLRWEADVQASNILMGVKEIVRKKRGCS